LEDLILHNPDGMLVLSDSGGVLFANPAAYQLLGESSANLQSQNLGPLLQLGPGQLWTVRGRQLEVRLAAFQWEGQEVHLATLRDVTAREQAHVAALEHEKSQAIQRFMRDISHDIKTPLTALSTGLYLLIRDPRPENQTQRVERMQSQISRLNKILDQALALNALEERESLSRQVYPLTPLVYQVLTRLEEAISQKGLALNILLSPGQEVWTEEALFQEMLAQLLENAIRYTPEGGHILLKTEARPGELLLEIEDTGIGIAPQHMPYVFDRFYRTDKARNVHTGGAGLGLALVKRIVQLHGGLIELKSVPEEGTSVQICLPLPHKQSP
jgi:signal transduction histidine kinase